MSEFDKAGKESFECVEIDIDFCNLEFGVTCSASLDIHLRECFNTRATCAVPAEYDKGVLTLRFIKNTQVIPDDGKHYIPSLIDVDRKNATINPGGGKGTTGAYGRRASLTARFKDHVYSDRITDPYLNKRIGRDPDYEPMDRATFWTKFKARNPYYLYREIRYISGYISDDLQIVDAMTYTYLWTSFRGPDPSDVVTIQAKDPLIRILGRDVKKPQVSSGKLASDIDETQTTVDLKPAGIGNQEYPSSGKGAIGKEICEFTRTGDTLTLTRDIYNTGGESHSVDDTFQLCHEYVNASPVEIFEDLAENIPDKFKDIQQWNDEGTNYLPRRYTRLIAEPTSVDKLVQEISQEMYFYPYYDERDAQIRITALRPSYNQDTIYDLTEERHLAKDKTDWADDSEQFYTAVLVRYGIINPAEGYNVKNFARRELILSDASNSDKYDATRIKEVMAPWIGNPAAAIELGNRILQRYENIPKQCAFTLEAKDREVWLGDFIRISHRKVVDALGDRVPINMQVFEVEEDQPGTTFNYRAQEYVFSQETLDPNEREIIISTAIQNYFGWQANLRELHDQEYDPNLSGDETIIFRLRTGNVVAGRDAHEFYEGELVLGGWCPTVNSSVPFKVVTNDLVPVYDQSITNEQNHSRGSACPVIDSSYTMGSDLKRLPVTTSLDTGDWSDAPNVKLKLIIEPDAHILGLGGPGQIHMAYKVLPFDQLEDSYIGFVSDGGHAMRVRHAIEIDNQGTIAGGGCGGVANCGVYRSSNFLTTLKYVDENFHIPGGGGAGAPAGVTIQTIEDSDEWNIRSHPTAGNNISGGDNGACDSIRDDYGTTWVSRSGNGAFPANSANEPFQELYYRELYGNNPGYAITEGANLITWINKGDVRGAEWN